MFVGLISLSLSFESIEQTDFILVSRNIPLVFRSDQILLLAQIVRAVYFQL